MNRCSKCGCQFRTLEDEHGDHPCPRCGYHYEDRWNLRPEDETYSEDDTPVVLKERPIIFNSEMVRAILDGTKSQTRRVMKIQPSIKPQTFIDIKGRFIAGWPGESEFDYFDCHCPYGKPGDRLWVRETWNQPFRATETNNGCIYRADYGWKGRPDLTMEMGDDQPWSPSIFMPRSASRITLEVTGVRVERVQEISEDDAEVEGISGEWHLIEVPSARAGFRALWDLINAKRCYGWDVNPWVWVVEFKPIDKET